jgi:hypothetical protein
MCTFLRHYVPFRSVFYCFILSHILPALFRWPDISLFHAQDGILCVLGIVWRRKDTSRCGEARRDGPFRF